jgi:hypothetical protein
MNSWSPLSAVTVARPSMWLTPVAKSGRAHSLVPNVLASPMWVQLADALPVMRKPPQGKGSNVNATGPLATMSKLGWPEPPGPAADVAAAPRAIPAAPNSNGNDLADRKPLSIPSSLQFDPVKPADKAVNRSKTPA